MFKEKSRILRSGARSLEDGRFLSLGRFRSPTNPFLDHRLPRPLRFHDGREEHVNRKLQIADQRPHLARVVRQMSEPRGQLFTLGFKLLLLMPGQRLAGRSLETLGPQLEPLAKLRLSCVFSQLAQSSGVVEWHLIAPSGSKPAQPAVTFPLSSGSREPPSSDREIFPPRG